jgi:hypothetical protein
MRSCSTPDWIKSDRSISSIEKVAAEVEKGDELVEPKVLASGSSVYSSSVREEVKSSSGEEDSASTGSGSTLKVDKPDNWSFIIPESDKLNVPEITEKERAERK